MRRFVIALLIAFWVFCIIAWPSLPERIPIHYNMRGRPDGWADALVGWFALPAVATLTILFFQVIVRAAAVTPNYWNVPEKQRFLALTEEQRRPIIGELITMLHITALYTLVIMIVIQASTYFTATGRGDGLSLLFHLVFWPGLIGLIAYLIWLHRRVKRMILAASAEAGS